VNSPSQQDRDPLVLVVPIGADTPPWSTLSWRDMVHVRKVFFHPPGKRGYPKEPAEQLAFRYDGCLQVIATIQEVVEVPCRSELVRFVPEIDGDACRIAYGGARVPHFVYRLKDLTVPSRRIPSGTVYRARKVNALLSTLLSAPSISAAVERSRDAIGR
jgi:hypothetical protein